MRRNKRKEDKLDITLKVQQLIINIYDNTVMKISHYNKHKFY